MQKQNILLSGRVTWPVHWPARIPCKSSACFRLYSASEIPDLAHTRYCISLYEAKGLY